MFRFEFVYSFAPMRPPRVSVTTFTSYICCIYTLKFGQYWTLFCYGNSSVSSMPYMQFLFVRPRLCRRLPSDSTSRWTPLPLANSSYCQVCSGLSPLSCNTCRAHRKNPSKPSVSLTRKDLLYLSLRSAHSSGISKPYFSLILSSFSPMGRTNNARNTTFDAAYISITGTEARRSDHISPISPPS